MNALNIISGLGGRSRPASYERDERDERDKNGRNESSDLSEQTRSRARRLPRRVTDAVVGFIRWLLAIIISPAHYLGGIFVGGNTRMAPSYPLSRLYGSWRKAPTPDRHPGRGTGSRSTREADVKRSIRIKLHDKKDGHGDGDEDDLSRVAMALKSPASGSSGTKLKYPHAPRPPRPLVPRRQPSFTNTPMSTSPSKKTLVIDLDETLIHSMAKGGRMSTGHMVEVKIAALGNGTVLGPQVPILYYVHERPYCHEFLRKVCKWYNLIVFTASVQEYADPVIDWLERERAYFSGRYYRQHCTYRNGAYIKDLSHVEPDLSKVVILDNSPMSYIFHEDNAVPIEGWISDPTDHDLLHLVPFFEGLQYVTDNGDITDPPPPPEPANTSFTASSSNLFCSTCIQNQHLLTSCLANYLPPESDPNYTRFEADYPVYRASLEQRYPPVCHDCEPGVRARIKASAQIARTDALSKSLGRINARKRHVSPVAVVWWLNLLLQTAWHGLCLLQRTELDHLIIHALCASLAVCWWRPGLGTKTIGARDFYIIQGLVICLRAVAWAIVRQTHRADLSKMIHAFMLVFLLSATVVSFQTIKPAPAPRFTFKDRDLKLVDDKSFRPPTKSPARPEKHFPIDRLAAIHRAQPPSPPDSDEDLALDADGMDWEPLPSTPSVQQSAPPAPAMTIRVEPPGQHNPSPFYGRLPPAPKSLESKLRNRANAQPAVFKPASDAKRADWFRKLRLSSPAFPARANGAAGDARTGVVGRVEDDDARTLRVAAPKWTLASDREEAVRGTGLEDLFGTSFRIRDEPGHEGRSRVSVARDVEQQLGLGKLTLGILVLPVVTGVGILAWQMDWAMALLDRLDWWRR